jgi:hypothetical protein
MVAAACDPVLPSRRLQQRFDEACLSWSAPSKLRRRAAESSACVGAKPYPAARRPFWLVVDAHTENG